MGRDASKASSNPWYQARINASKYDDRLRSREGAAELLGMSVSSISDAELGLYKVMPVDKAVLMADLYNAPNLLNYYCLNECPIGCRLTISDEVCDLDRITVKLLHLLQDDKLQGYKDLLLEIAKDGKVNDFEYEDFMKVVNYLGEIGKCVSEIKILADGLKDKKNGV